ncbi:hypothetical protein [Lentzea sp. NBRC 102530]|uniref:hypothetical protein n=1 Tax=Lentzea sp. NBRC 102530 TaxID=3032201 RepID=UPI0024A55875|nr:hypothetical protein [Lentzea sp. NBRC 102530]GLY48930.1 hypothetical protein Lesp01_25860 [Lentzea sp. NBRC 102530]
MSSASPPLSCCLGFADAVPLAQAVAALGELELARKRFRLGCAARVIRKSTWPYDSPVRLRAVITMG